MTGIEKGPDWQCVTEHAEWEPRDSCAELAYKDHLWIMGGWFHQSEPNPRDVWKSADGKHWENVTHEAPWEKSDLPLGLVFKDRMWHMGGTSDFYHSNDDTLYNDIWSSADGETWDLECDEAPWSRRAYHKVVELNGTLWLTAGGPCNDGQSSCNDVWSSEDGVHWECVLEQAPWPARIWHGSVVYRGRIWVIAGDDLSDTRLLNDVWFSKNGSDWTQLESDVVFSKRHEISPYLFRDKLWVTAGHAWPLSNEVWSLELPTDF